MRSRACAIAARTAVAAATCIVSTAFALGGAQAQTTPYVMKITTPTIHAAPDMYARNLAAAVEKDSGGRIKAQVYPASQLGSIPRQIEGTQFGSIQCAVIPPEFFVGVDQRFEVLAAPGLVSTVAQGQGVAANPVVLKAMLALGGDKGLLGAGLFYAEPAEVVSKTPIRHLADFKGKKLRIFASEFQSEAFKRLGATPVAMSPGDVLPAIQQGTLDGAAFGVQLLSGLHFYDSAKYVAMTSHSAIFIIVEISKKWHDSLPKDLQAIVDRDAAKEATAINPQALDILNGARKAWTDHGGELIALPADEQTKMLQTLVSVGDDVAAKKPLVKTDYEIVKEAAQKLK
ncbi:MAG TPA: TRAP transporter substrate-binding protein [Xanthobacteraceae bacterium]